MSQYVADIGSMSLDSVLSRLCGLAVSGWTISVILPENAEEMILEEIEWSERELRHALENNEVLFACLASHNPSFSAMLYPRDRKSDDLGYFHCSLDWDGRDREFRSLLKSIQADEGTEFVSLSTSDSVVLDIEPKPQKLQLDHFPLDHWALIEVAFRGTDESWERWRGPQEGFAVELEGVLKN